ncbi:hypothetical protein GCM10029964_118570 [Kibdelosporangium lantanae]
MRGAEEYLPRRAAELVAEALLDTRVVIVNGARQTGKSTLAEPCLRVHQVADIQRGADMRRLVGALAARSGGPLNYSRLSSDLALPASPASRSVHCGPLHRSEFVGVDLGHPKFVSVWVARFSPTMILVASPMVAGSTS